jgi:hypothetical protein
VTQNDPSRIDLRDWYTPGQIGRRPSLLRYSPALFILVILIADAGQVSDPDLWSHIRFGQAALAGHNLTATLLGSGIARRDIYSYSVFGDQWRDPEWLSEVIMAAFYGHVGIIGLKIWKFACVAATLGFLMIGLVESGASPPTQFNLLTVAALGLWPQIQFRPQIFTFALLAAMLAILARDNYRGAARLWLIPPMMTLWSNLHGGFIVGIVALAAYAAVAGFTDLIAGRGLGRGMRLGLLTAIATLTTFVTPYGLESWGAMLHSVGNQATRTAITEWQPLWPAMARQWHQSAVGEFSYLLALGLMASLIVSFARTPRVGDLPMVAIAALMSAGSFVAARNIPLAVIACAIPLARLTAQLPARTAAGYQSVKRTALSDRSGVNQWIVIALAIFVVISMGLFSPRLETDLALPSGAVGFMQQHDLHGNLLNDYGWGSYLIWHIGPRSRLFIDGRCETVYPDNVINDYIQFYFNFAQAGRVLHGYPHDLILIPPEAPAYHLLENSPEWKLVYRDRTAVLFVRANSAAAKLPGVPIEGVSPTTSYFP